LYIESGYSAGSVGDFVAVFHPRDESENKT
jgi:hypothetical protein